MSGRLFLHQNDLISLLVVIWWESNGAEGKVQTKNMHKRELKGFTEINNSSSFTSLFAESANTKRSAHLNAIWHSHANDEQVALQLDLWPHSDGGKLLPACYSLKCQTFKIILIIHTFLKKKEEEEEENLVFLVCLLMKRAAVRWGLWETGSTSSRTLDVTIMSWKAWRRCPLGTVEKKNIHRLNWDKGVWLLMFLSCEVM